MIRWVLVIIGGLLLGTLVHLASVLALPRTASHDAYARLLPLAPLNTVTLLPPPSPGDAVMPFMDPAFATAVCRYDLSESPMKFSVPVSQAYTSVSFYTRNGVAYYAINDRAAGRRVIELDLMTSRQRADLPDEEDMTAADRLIVESPSRTGLIVIRALATEPSLLAAAQRTLRGTKCQPQPLS
jgi:uncharacterized membrane protein